MAGDVDPRIIDPNEQPVGFLALFEQAKVWPSYAGWTLVMVLVYPKDDGDRISLPFEAHSKSIHFQPPAA